jgi:hypothetical protein
LKQHIISFNENDGEMIFRAFVFVFIVCVDATIGRMMYRNTDKGRRGRENLHNVAVTSRRRRRLLLKAFRKFAI